MYYHVTIVDPVVVVVAVAVAVVVAVVAVAFVYWETFVGLALAPVSSAWKDCTVPLRATSRPPLASALLADPYSSPAGRGGRFHWSCTCPCSYPHQHHWREDGSLLNHRHQRVAATRGEIRDRGVVVTMAVVVTMVAIVTIMVHWS